MQEEPIQFLYALSNSQISISERAVALLWWHGLREATISISAKQLTNEIESGGYSKPNVTRLTQSLKKDGRITQGPNGTFRVKITARQNLDKKYMPFVKQRPIRESDSLLSTDMFSETRGYIEKVVAQINASYDYGLYDCCAVMCRRLLETLIIEVYEAKGFADDLKGNDGYYKMFSGLLAQLEKETRFNLSRNSLEGLKNFKRLGDESAHNRRFNARKEDIDRIRDGMRVAAEDLLHLANLA